MKLDFGMLSKGQPLKTKSTEEASIDSKFYRLGYQNARLDADRQIFEQQKQMTMQELEAARQALLNAQLEQASMAAQMQGPMGPPGTMMPPPAMGGAPMPMGAPPMPAGAAPPGQALPPGVGDMMGAYSGM
jgi:hypothetical protein